MSQVRDLKQSIKVVRLLQKLLQLLKEEVAGKEVQAQKGLRNQGGFIDV